MTQKLRWMLCAIIVAMVALPKSGIAVSGMPFNTLYFLAMGSLPILGIIALSKASFLKVELSDLYIFLIVPFWAIFIIITLSNGVGSLGIYAGALIALVGMPLFFYIIFKISSDETIKSSLPVLVYCIRFAAAWGLILFAYKTATGSFFEIPGITTTLGAEKSLAEKMNDRGAFSKLVSTYNNGNIYGVCIMMLLPLYRVLDKSRLWLVIVVSSIVLSLSRTVWALLIISFIFDIIFSGKISIKKMSAGLFLLVAASALIFFMLGEMGRDSSFLADQTLGGRSGYLGVLFNAQFISDEPLDASYEIPYVTIVQYVGIVGVFPFLMYFSSLGLNVRTLFKRRTPIRRGAVLGCLLYFVATFSDAALILVPAFSIFSFITFLSMRKIDEIDLEASVASDHR